MNTLLEELTGGIPDWTQFQRVVIRLVAAIVVGAIIGLQRQRAGKSAGLRTHILVALGSALFVLEGERAMMSMSDLSRVIQGLATGIGFLGAGAILKESAERKIEGRTTASGIWDDGRGRRRRRARPSWTRAPQRRSRLGDTRTRRRHRTSHRAGQARAQ